MRGLWYRTGGRHPGGEDRPDWGTRWEGGRKREVRKWGSPILPLPWGPGWNQTLSGLGGCMEGARSRVSLWHVELDPRGG